MNQISFKIAGALALATILVACGTNSGRHFFASPDLEGRAGAELAILPFDNLSDDQGAARSMENLVLIAFLNHSPIKIIDPGQVTSALLEERIRLATSIPKETLRRLGERLGVDFFLLGVVHEYRLQRVTGAAGSGEVPVVSLTLRMLDAASGDIVWASSAARRGNDDETVFGIGRIDSLERLAQVTVGEIAKDLSMSLR